MARRAVAQRAKVGRNGRIGLPKPYDIGAPSHDVRYRES
jgi:hypothetical protein